MSARSRNVSVKNRKGDVQDPLISSTEGAGPYVSFIRPRTSLLRTSIPTFTRPIPNVFEKKNDTSTRKAIFIVILIFGFSLLTIAFIYNQFPDLEEHEKEHVKLPLNLDDAKNLGLVLNRYKEKYFYEVLFGVVIVYVFLQAFAIPGSIFLSILLGYLFPFYLAITLICCCSALGATLCFLLSNLVGKKLVKRFFPAMAAEWAKTVEKHKNNLLNYIIFLRVTPFLPNWFINMTAPVIGVPLIPFALGTFIGVAPPSFIAIQTGQTLQTLSSTSSTWSWTSIIMLTLFAIVSMLPVLLKHKLQKKFN